MRYRPCGGAVAPASLRGRPSSSGAELAALEHRPDERPHHVAQERVGGDLERDDVLVELDPPHLLHHAHEHLVPRLGRRERAEVVLAEQRLRARVCGRDVERPRPPQRALRLERRPLAAPPDAVAIRARPGVEPRVEVVRRLLGARRRRRRPGAPRSAPRPRARPAGRPSTSTETTFASACTPVSVLPATARPVTGAVELVRARAAARPRPSAPPAGAPSHGSPVPSYSIVSFRRTSGPPDVACKAFLML